MFRSRKRETSKIAEQNLKATAELLRASLAPGLPARFVARIGALPLEDDAAPFSWIEPPRLAYFKPEQALLTDGVTALLPSLLDYLERNKGHDPVIREINADLIQKLEYVSSLVDAVKRVLEGFDCLDESNLRAYLEGIFRLLDEFVSFESCFAEQKSLVTWNRLKPALSSKLTAADFASLARFYSNFSRLAAICNEANFKARTALNRLRQALSERLDERTAKQAVQAASEALQALQMMLHAVSEFIDTIK